MKPMDVIVKKNVNKESFLKFIEVALDPAKQHDVDYAMLFYLTQHNFNSFEECKAHWLNEDMFDHIEDIIPLVKRVSEQIAPKLEAWAELVRKNTDVEAAKASEKPDEAVSQ